VFKDAEVLNRLSGTLPLERWFQFVQQSPNYFAWMVYEKDVVGAVGQIEIEIYPDRTAAIGLLTNPDLRNKGYGKRIIRNLLKRPELRGVEIIRASIESDNSASIHCFKGSGFIEEGSDDEGLLILTYRHKDIIDH